MDLSIERGKVILRFEDHGIAFDASEFDSRVPDGDLAERPVGKLGLPLVRQFAEDLSYCRADGINRLVVRIGL
jgi:anti-sigma regulatory factor (Ser/Thr protein kinase)